MSSMRNAIQRRNHRERAQPLGREKWGLLEKHKDYALRAKDHREKKARLKILKEKAVFANPDEFSFKMMSLRTKDGQRLDGRGGQALPMSVVNLLKTQDAGYIRTMLQKTRREREKLEMEVQIEEGEGHERVVPLKSTEDEEERRKVKFVGSRREQADMVGDEEESAEDEEQDKQGVRRKLSKKDADTLRWQEIEKGRARKKRAHAQEVRRGLLDAVRERENDLLLAEQELDLQRAKMTNNIGGVSKAGVKFKIRERKR